MPSNTNIYKVRIFAIALGLVSSACSNINYVEENKEFDNPPAAIREKMKMFMPMYEAWMNETIFKYAKSGQTLNSIDLAWARQLGIRNLEKIRILRMDFFPMPDSSLLNDELERLGMGSPYEDARNMGYLIFIRPDRDTPKARAEQIAQIYLMEKLSPPHFLYRQFSEMRMIANKPDQPLNIETRRLVRCIPDAQGKVTLSCKLNGNKAENGPSNNLFEGLWKKKTENKNAPIALSNDSNWTSQQLPSPAIINDNTKNVGGVATFEQLMKQDIANLKQNNQASTITVIKQPKEQVLKTYEVVR